MVSRMLPLATAGMERLVACMKNKTGQSCHLRNLLYSLWNGHPTRMVEIVNLDRSLRSTLLSVMCVLGSNTFFYDEISKAIKAAGLFDSFIKAHISKAKAS